MQVNFADYYQPKSKQLAAHANRTKYLLFGGAMGGGKSWFLCAEAIRNAMEFAGNRLVVIRKERSVIVNTILVTFFQICPPAIIKDFNRSALQITFINGSILNFLSADKSKDPLLNKLKGLEIGWFGIDEANEISIEAYQILKTRMRWILPNGKKPRYEGRLTSNPENCWLISEFIQSVHPDTKFIQSLTTDNYDPNSEYVQTLTEAFKDNPILLKRYLEGDWSLVDTINQLISSTTIQICQNATENSYITGMGVDVARFGDDRTVFIILIDGNVEKIETYYHTSIDQTANRAITLMQDYNIDSGSVGVDAVGVGAGVIDILSSKGYEVTEIQGGRKADEKEENEYQPAFKPFNLRSQMYYELSEAMKDGKIGNIKNQSLKQELSAIQYEIVAERTVKILPKAAIKKLTGRSPDLADALSYAYYAANMVHNAPFIFPFKIGDVIVDLNQYKD